MSVVFLSERLDERTKEWEIMTKRLYSQNPGITVKAFATICLGATQRQMR
jgi:hypothetical protein